MSRFSIQLTLAALGAWLVTMLGEWSMALSVLCVLITLDVVSGFLRAAIQQELSSKESWRGILKKAMIAVVVVVGAMVDRLLAVDLFRNALSIFYCASEALSVLENVVGAGMPVPKWLYETLAELKDRKFPHRDSQAT